MFVMLQNFSQAVCAHHRGAGTWQTLGCPQLFICGLLPLKLLRGRWPGSSLRVTCVQNPLDPPRSGGGPRPPASPKMKSSECVNEPSARGSAPNRTQSRNLRSVLSPNLILKLFRVHPQPVDRDPPSTPPSASAANQAGKRTALDGPAPVWTLTERSFRETTGDSMPVPDPPAVSRRPTAWNTPVS